jgi:hypothetical protein
MDTELIQLAAFMKSGLPYLANIINFTIQNKKDGINTDETDNLINEFIAKLQYIYINIHICDTVITIHHSGQFICRVLSTDY